MLTDMNTFYSRLTGLTLLAGSALAALGVPANPVPRTFTQPDGSTIALSQRGDEFCSFFTTEQGLVVRQDASGWYRVVANDGSLTTLTPAQFATDATLMDAYSAESAYNSIQAKAAATPFARNARLLAPASTRAKVLPGSKFDNSDGHDIRKVPTDGSPHVLVILVDFTDCHFSFCDDPHTEMTQMMTKPGYSNFGHNGSAFDFYRDQSRGIYTPQFDVFGPVQLPQNMAYYGGNDSNGNDQRPHQMVIDACRLLDSEIDFSKYDTNGDGDVDNVYVFYAGYGENDGGGSNCIWPHSYSVEYRETPPVLDGVRINRYACSNELNYRPNSSGALDPTGIGTFCHEFGHVLGQPDMYATDYSDAFTPGAFSAMDHGSYNNNGRTPPNFSAYERYAMEWICPVPVTEASTINMLPLGGDGNVYKITINPNKPTEYWLFENRQQSGWDTYIPGQGMLVWHIDYDENVWRLNKVNNTASHQHVDLVEADGTQNSGSQDGDTFPGTRNVTSLTAATSPAFRNWDSKTSDLPITDIEEAASGIISFNVAGGSLSSPIAVAQPTPRQTAGSASSITVEWPAVQGADDYIVSVWSEVIDPLFGDITVEMVPGYELATISSNSIELDGLAEETTYVCQVHARSSRNLSPVGEGRFSTFASDFASSTPSIEITPSDVSARVDWVELPDATEYLLTVATRAEGPYTTVEQVGFDNKKKPVEWTFTGTYDERSDYSGLSTPSLRFGIQDANLMSGFYTADVAEIDFWARVNRQNAKFSLDFYGVNENGTLTKFATINDVASNKAGSEIKITDIPDGVRQWICIYTFSTADLTLNIDDIVVKTRGTVTDTPLAGYDALVVKGNSYTVTGLQRSTSYVASLQARNAAGTSLASPARRFTTLAQSGISQVAGSDDSAPRFVVSGGVLRTDATEPFNVYTTDGRTIAINRTGSVALPAPGIYIVRCGTYARTVKY